MTLNLITLANVKIELGLSVTTYDVAITAMIPKVSSDVRRILNTGFSDYHYASFVSGVAEIKLADVSNYFREVNSIIPIFRMGQVVYHPNIPADTYLTGYDPDTEIYTLSAAPTGDGDYIYATLNIAQWAAISKMIWYRIQHLVTTDTETKAVSSESYGPVSVTYTDKEINKQWNYPQVLIDDLGIPFARIG